MRRLRRRPIVVLLLGALLAVLLPVRASIGRSAAAPAVAIISPPPLVSVPVGQGLELRYRAAGDTARLQLWTDGVCLHDDPVLHGGDVIHTWAPDEPNPHHLTICARAADGSVLGCVERMVIGLPRGSPVHVHLVETPSPDAMSGSRLNLASEHPPWR
jgi:hypothetical protein